MTIYSNSFNDEIVSVINAGGIGVLRTDTLYGIVARADNQAAVERVFTVKQRTPTKPPISLISSVDQLFDSYDQQTIDRLSLLWPGKKTVILEGHDAPEWLMRGTQSVSYRLPNGEDLRELISKTGPLIAPSANPEGKQPAQNIEQAKAYFGDAVDFYVDGGMVTDNTPSHLYRLHEEGLERLR